jgi:predicted GTPase
MSSTLAQYTTALTEKLEAVMAAFRQKPADPELQTLLTRWDAQIARMRATAEGEDHVSIALLGGTGAGKSTLINALLGQDLLPTHSFSVCTAAAIEISYAPTRQIALQVELIPLESWEAEKQAFLDEIAESRASGQNLLGRQDFIFKAWSLYQHNAGPPPLPFPLEDMLTLLAQPLPAEVQNLMRQGLLLSRYREAADLRVALSRLLTAHGPLWPLLKRVVIRGPFELLKGGLKLLDLPGLNDPNPVREAITRACLKQAEFVWLTFNLSRGLTRDVMDLLKEQGFLTQIILDGTLSALALIGTRADQFVPALERQQLGLPPETSLDTLLATRREHIQARIREQLSELTLWFSHRYRVQAQTREVVQLIGSTLERSPIFVVSALEDQRLAGWFEGEGLLQNRAQTGMDELRAWLGTIVASHGLQARKKLIRSQCQQMNQEIKRLLQSRQSRTAVQSLAAPQRQTLSAQLAVACQHLEQGLTEIQNARRARHQQMYAGFLAHCQEALQRAHQDLPELVSGWGAHPWQLLQRTVAHQGVYTSPSSGVRLHLPEACSEHLLGGLAPAWNACFSDSVEREPDHLLAELTQLHAQFGAQIAQQAPACADRWAEIQASSTQILHEKALQISLELREHLKHSRRALSSQILAQIQQVLLPICAGAAGLKGTGLKQQILTQLQTGLSEAWPTLEEALLAALSAPLQALDQELEQALSAMSQVLHEQAELVSGGVSP